MKDVLADRCPLKLPKMFNKFFEPLFGFSEIVKFLGIVLILRVGFRTVDWRVEGLLFTWMRIVESIKEVA